MNINYVENIMNEMGWGDGNFIPIANTENQNLMDKISNLQKYRTERENELKSIADRAAKLESHYKNAECSIDQNSKLLSANRSDLNSETHMHKILERETNKLDVDKKAMSKEIAAYEEYDRNVSRSIKTFMKTIEGLTAKIRWAQTSLQEWKLAMDGGEEANQMIEKYCKNDEQRAGAMDNKRKILITEIKKKREKFIEEIEIQKSLEKSLDRTAELYRRTHAERRKMVDTWKDAVRMMNQRENEIRCVEDLLDAAITQKEEKLHEYKENENFLNQLIENNKDIELDIARLNKQISSSRAHYDELITLITLKENENLVIKKQLQAVVINVQQQRNKNKQSLKSKTEKEDEVVKISDSIKDLRKRHKNFLNKHLSATERLGMIEEMIDNEEKLKEQLTNEISRINGLGYRAQERLLMLRSEEKLLEADNTAISASIGSLKRNLIEQKKNIIKETEEEYDLGMRCQLLEIKIAKLSGFVVDINETIKHEQKLERLEKEAAHVAKQKSKIQSQIEKLESDIKSMTNSYADDTKVIKELNFKLKELTLYVEVGEKQIREKNLANQEKIVEMSILKMRIHQMETQIAKCQNKVLNLEKFRIEIEKAVTERMLQLKVEIDVLQTKRRHLQEERGAYKMDLAERQLKIDATVKRYMLCLDLLGKNDDGSCVTATQLKIENAQEKQMLLLQGNETNAKIVKAEREIKQMENTLYLLNFSNNKYRQNFEKIEDESTELKEMQKQEEIHFSTLQRLRAIKAEIDDLSKKIDSSVETRDTIERQIEEQMRIRVENSDILMKVHKELLEQKTKLQRAEREIRYATRDIRQRSFTDAFLMNFERDIFLKEILQRNNSALQLFADLIDSNMEMTSDVLSFLDDKGLKLPQIQVVKPRSATSWRSNYSDITISCSSKAISSLLSASSRLSEGSEDSDSGKFRMGTSRPSIISIDFQPSENLRDSETLSGKSSIKTKTTKPKSK